MEEVKGVRASTRIVLHTALVSFTFAMIGTAYAAESPNHKQKYVYVEDLPIWGKDRSGLEFLDSSPPMSQSTSARYISGFSFWRTHVPPAGLLPDGWIVDPPSPNGRATWFSRGTIDFILRNPRLGKIATWTIEEARIKVLFKGSDHPAGISGAHVLNKRYLAFSVTDGSFIFFDRRKGEFVPQAVKASRRTPEEVCRNEPFNFVYKCEGDRVGLFLSPQDDVLVTARGKAPRYAPLPLAAN